MLRRIAAIGLTATVAISSHAADAADAADAEYVATMCEVQPDGALWLQLRTLSGAGRSITVDAGTNTIIFKGTTLSDGKWISTYKSVKEAVWRSPGEGSIVGMVELVSDHGAKALAWVSPACWQRLREATNGALVMRIQVGV